MQPVATCVQVPAHRYRPSYRTYPEVLPQLSYAEDYRVKKVDCRGRIAIQNRQIFVGIPFAKEIIGIRETLTENVIEIYYCHQKLGHMDLSKIPKNSMINLYSHRIIK